MGAAVVPIIMYVWYRFEDHWWWDNLSHFMAGYAFGAALADQIEPRTILIGFLLLATGWEIFEYRINERPWDGSMDWDHAMEDTVLDTYMGLSGAYTAMIINA